MMEYYLCSQLDEINKGTKPTLTRLDVQFLQRGRRVFGEGDLPYLEMMSCVVMRALFLNN